MGRWLLYPLLVLVLGFCLLAVLDQIAPSISPFAVGQFLGLMCIFAFVFGLMADSKRKKKDAASKEPTKKSSDGQEQK